MVVGAKLPQTTEFIYTTEMAKPLIPKGVWAETLVPAGPERFTLDLLCKQGVGGSSPLTSTSVFNGLEGSPLLI